MNGFVWGGLWRLRSFHFPFLTVFRSGLVGIYDGLKRSQKNVLDSFDTGFSGWSF